MGKVTVTRQVNLVAIRINEEGNPVALPRDNTLHIPVEQFMRLCKEAYDCGHHKSLLSEVIDDRSPEKAETVFVSEADEHPASSNVETVRYTRAVRINTMLDRLIGEDGDDE